MHILCCDRFVLLSMVFEEIVRRVFDVAWFSSHPPWPKAGKSGTVSFEFCQDAGKEEIGQ